ncbi:MAG TPA: hypothetical protein H9860_03105 [Candidatus Gemmiger faecavium]|nr:hypothetical protein [Candidatus Gemmiger faecavium]
MSRRDSQGRASFSPTQRKACLVLAGCFAAIIVSFVAAWILPDLLFGSTGDYDPDAYPVDTSLGAVLTESSDAGSEYLSSTVFVGDDNVVALTASSSITIDRYVGENGLSVSNMSKKSCVYFEDDSSAYTIPQAIAKMKPRRVIVMIGKNDVDGNTTVDSFIQSYTQALDNLHTAYEYCDIIVSAIPPVTEDSSDAAVVQTRIDQFNQALAQMCEDNGYKYLNSAEELKSSNGYAEGAYVSKDTGVMTSSGVNAYLDYVTTHAYETEDRRPDTNDIPRRAAEAADKESTATPSPTPVRYTVSYKAEAGKGTLTGNDQTGASSLEFEVSENDTVTITAVAAEGYTFYKWDDGQTNPKRVDVVTKDISVTALFNDARVALTLDRGDTTMTVGDSVTFNASVTLGGKEYSNSNVQWAINDELEQNGGSFTFTPSEAGTYKLKAGIEVNGGRAEVTVNITVESKPTKVTLTAPTTLTAGTSTTLSASVENGSGETTWACPQLPSWSATGNQVQFSASQPGRYYVQATNNGVTAELAIEVTAAPTPTPTPNKEDDKDDD